MGSEQPLPSPLPEEQANPLPTNVTSQLPAANGEESGDSGSESNEFPSARQVIVVGSVRVVKDDKGPSKKAEDAVKSVDTLEKDREESKEDPYPFELDYQTIRNILQIKENPVYSAAFDEWNRQLKEIKVKLAEKESEKAGYTTQVYNIIGFFSVYQGVVLTAVSQLSSGSGDKCRKTWVPVLLSAITAFVTLCALYNRFASLRQVEDLFVEPRKARNDYQKKVGNLLKYGKHFRFYKDYSEKETLKDQSKKTPKDRHRTPKKTPKETLKSSQGSDVLHNGVLVSVVLFTGVFILSYFVILCDKLLI